MPTQRGTERNRHQFILSRIVCGTMYKLNKLNQPRIVWQQLKNKCTCIYTNESKRERENGRKRETKRVREIEQKKRTFSVVHTKKQREWYHNKPTNPHAYNLPFQSIIARTVSALTPNIYSTRF